MRIKTNKEINNEYEELKKKFSYEFDKDKFSKRDQVSSLFNSQSPERFMPISSDHFVKPAKAEVSYTDKYIKKILTKIFGVDEDDLIGEAKFTYTDKGKQHNFYPDIQIDSKFRDKKGILIEVEEIGSNLETMENHGIFQAKKWFNKAKGLSKRFDAIITNFTDWYYLSYREGKKNRFFEICQKKNLVEIYQIFRDFYIGIQSDYSSPKDQSTIFDFYDDFVKIIKEILEKKNKKKIICNNKLKEQEQIRFLRIIFFRLFFIKTLQSWGILKYNVIKNYVFSPKERLDYYRNLKTLFFKVFNAENHSHFSSEILRKTPFLNGGLFRKREIEINNSDLALSSFAIEYIWKILNKYRYDFKENSENESVITPKALGHIFELTIDQSGGDRKGTGSFYTPNVVTEYINHKTITETIIDNVNQEIKEIWDKNEQTNIETLVDSIFLDKYNRSSKKEIADLFMRVMKKIRICDNACGSGAFLEGAMNELIKIYKIIYDSLNYKWLPLLQKPNKDNEDSLYFSSLYQMRRYILIHNIYGVDIQKESIEIARLRLWLWLVNPMDFTTEKLYKIHKIEPLPNIEFNILSGNTLLGFASYKSLKRSIKMITIGRLLKDVSQIQEILDLKKKYKLSKSKREGDILRSQILKKKTEYYRDINNLLCDSKFSKIEREMKPIKISETTNKKELLSQLQNLFNKNNISFVKIDFNDKYTKKNKVKSITNRLKGMRYSSRGDIVYCIYSVNGKDVSYNRLEQMLNSLNLNDIRALIFRKIISPIDLEQKKVFHWVFEFLDVFQQGGFDIIIGNPPYRQNGLNKLDRKLISNEWDSYALDSKNNGGSYNQSAIFIERSYNLLRKNGTLGYIVNNSIARVNEFKKIRKYILKKMKILELRDEGNPFKESGVTLEMITLIAKKKKSQDNIISLISERDNFSESVNQNIFLKYNRFFLYYDPILKYILNLDHTKINLLSGTRGRGCSKKTKPNGDYNIPCYYSGKSIKKYRTDFQEIEFAKEKRLENEYNAQWIILTKINNKYRAIVKPKETIIGNNVCKITLPNKEKDYIEKKPLMVILNSELMDYIVFNYLINRSELTIAFTDSITKMTPIPKIPAKFNELYRKLADILTFTYQTNIGKRTFKEYSDCLVYELFFSKKYYKSEDNEMAKDFPFHTILDLLIQPINFNQWKDLKWKQITDKLSFKEEKEIEKVQEKNLKIINNLSDLLKSNKDVQKVKQIICSHNWTKKIRSFLLFKQFYK